MTTEKKGSHYPPGIPMSEEELREWKKTFTDIQENIDNIMGETDGRHLGKDCRPLCKESD